MPRHGMNRPRPEVGGGDLRPLMRAQPLFAGVAAPVEQIVQAIAPIPGKRHAVAHAGIVAGQDKVLKRAFKLRLGIGLNRVRGRAGEIPHGFHGPNRPSAGGQVAQRPFLILKLPVHIQAKRIAVPAEPNFFPAFRRGQRKFKRGIPAEALSLAAPDRVNHRLQTAVIP